MSLDQSKTPVKYVMYLRKSSEDEDRQAASLPAQRKELEEVIKRDKLNVVAVFEESQSAHSIGRPKFNEMVKMIDSGQANGILVWHINRIARNALDGGMIVHLFDHHKLTEIRAKNSRHDGSGNDKMMLQIEFAMSKKYSDDLSDIVKRGNKQKFLERKEWIGLAKQGYLNVQDPITKSNVIAVDPDRFPLLQQAMKLIISGEYSISEVYHKLTNEWGYRTRQRRKTGNAKLHKPAFYRILRDTYYYGLMIRKEGKVIGTHTPMLTKQEFLQLQARIGSWSKNKSEIDLPYRGLLKCNECNSAIVGQEKWQIICSECKLKFHRGNKVQCPRCGIKITEMKNAKLLHYTYYGCTKKKNPNCSQKGLIEVKKLDEQIKHELTRYEIPEDFKIWSIKYLNEIHDNESYRQNIVAENLTKRLLHIKDELNQLLKTKISPNNHNGELLSEEEYLELRKRLIEDRESLEEQIEASDTIQDQYMELTEKTFNFVCYAKYWFEHGDSHEKSLILKSLGYNLTLQGKKVQFTSNKPFYLVRKTYEILKEKAHAVEPNKKIGDPINYDSLPDVHSILSERQDSNLRPRRSERRALAICATPRLMSG